MKVSLSKFAVITIAIVVVVFPLAIIGKSVVNGSIQRAYALLPINSKMESRVDTRTTIPISGRYIIGVTVREDFLEKGTEKIIKTIYINGKEYEFTTDNVSTEIESGFYDVIGKLDPKTNKVIISSAKFSGYISDGVLDRDNVSTSTSSTVKKKKKVAVFLFDYQDSSTQPFYPSDVHEIMFGNGKFKNYFKEASYDRLLLSGEIFGWYTIGHNAGNGPCQADVETDLAAAISGSSINLNNYGNIVIISLCNGQVANGQSNTGPTPYNINGTTYNKTVTWVNVSASTWNQISSQMMEGVSGMHILTNLERLLTHEFGHALGLMHANAISCMGTLPTAECQGVGVGNHYDTMAYETIGLHLNAWAKAKLGWFTGTELQTITQSGTYTIGSLESQPGFSQLSVVAKAFKVKPSINSPKTPIWIEFRKAVGFDTGINTPAFGGIQGGGGEAPPYNIAENQNGIMIYKEGFEGIYSGAINPATASLMYLRGAPNLGTGSNPYQVSLNPGQIYSEPRYGLSITTIPTSSTTSRKFEVTMNPGFACTHLQPALDSWQLNNTYVSAGTSTIINNLLVNKDYLSCPNASFTYSFNFGQLEQNGSTPGLESFLSNLSPDDERRFIFGVFVPTGTVPGIYDVVVTITNTSSGLSSTDIVPISVQ